MRLFARPASSDAAEIAVSLEEFNIFMFSVVAFSHGRQALCASEMLNYLRSMDILNGFLESSVQLRDGPPRLRNRT